MKYKRLGACGLKVSELWLGGMSLGDPKLRPWVLDAKDSRAMIERALHHGINVIDTCDVYCSGRSEEIIGDFLSESGLRKEIVLATKLGWPFHKKAGVNGSGFSRKYIIEACDASLKRLKTDYIDLYQTHIWQPDTHIEEMVDAFDHLVQSGKVLYVGATDMPAWQFAKSIYFARHTGKNAFVSMQHHYNPIWREDERELMPLCREEEIGLVPYSPLGRGFLCRGGAVGNSLRSRTDEKIPEYYSRASDLRVAQEISRLAQELACTPTIVSLSWVLSTPGVVATVVGPCSISQLDELVNHPGVILTSEQRARIEEPYSYRAARASH